MSKQCGDKQRFGSVQVEVTSRCNLRCRTCVYHYFESAWQARDLSETAFQRVLEVAHRCDSIHLQGWGETLLREDAPNLIVRIKKTGAKVSLSSNGTVFTRNGPSELLEAGLDSMAFSFAGSSADTQDPLRGQGTFAMASSSVQQFSKARNRSLFPPLLLNYLMTPANLATFPRAVALCGRLGADGIRPTQMVHIATREQEQLVAYDRGLSFRWSFAISRLSALLRGISLVLPRLNEALVPVCEKNPLANFFVGSDGSVSPCVYLNPPLAGDFPRLFRGLTATASRVVMGNLHCATVDQIWESRAYVEFRERFRRRLELHDNLLASVTPDFEGMERLEKSVLKLRALYTEEFSAPEQCRLCGQLYGF